MRSDLVDIPVTLHHETDKAWLVSDTGDRSKAVWVPKSQAEIEPASKGVHTRTLPERLATEKGLV